jgi:hypothetical protein
MGPKVLGRPHKAIQVPAGIPLGTKEVRSHVIVDSNDGLGALIKIADQLRTDQSTGSGN